MRAEEKKEKKVKIYKKPVRYCPRCGAPVRLAAHANRFSCGKCGYYEKRS